MKIKKLTEKAIEEFITDFEHYHYELLEDHNGTVKAYREIDSEWNIISATIGVEDVNGNSLNLGIDEKLV